LAAVISRPARVQGKTDTRGADRGMSLYS